jgi:hypothetical protein
MPRSFPPFPVKKPQRRTWYSPFCKQLLQKREHRAKVPAPCCSRIGTDQHGFFSIREYPWKSVSRKKDKEFLALVS